MEPISQAPADKKIVKGDFTLTVPLNREKTKMATFEIREMDEDVYNMARTFLDKGKEFDAVRMIIKALRVSGDDPNLLVGNFIATKSASILILDLIEPVEGELKKN
jgi:hypothetical protein